MLDRYHPFCPGAGELARVSDDGPDIATYPQFCGGNPFTLGAVWGIDSGWASSASVTAPTTHQGTRRPLHRHRVHRSDYQTLFGVAPQDASVSIDVRVKTTKRSTLPTDLPGGGLPRPTPARRCACLGGPPSVSVPIMTNPDPSIRPDLVALPAWGITIDHQRKDAPGLPGLRRHGLGQGAVADGRRGVPPSRRAVMDGWEYFYSNGDPVGRAPAGDLMYDARPGHQHWHFEQFARYSFLGADQTQIVLSEKTGFCLAPTDAIDLTTPGAEWNPYSVGLATACGSRSSIWTREVLPRVGATRTSRGSPDNRSTSRTWRTACTSSPSRRTPMAC